MPGGDLGQNSIVQYASQFNKLESQGNYVTDVNEYIYDSTQGPQGVTEAAAELYRRHEAVVSGRESGMLEDVLTDDVRACYQDGYLELGRLPEQNRRNFLNSLRSNISKFKISPTWVYAEKSGNYHIQVLSAAPSFQGYPRPQEGSVNAEICDLLVVPQYEALAELAVIRSKESVEPVVLHYTCVGQGAFNNQSSVMDHAFRGVAEIVRGHNVRVVVHGWSREAVRAIKNSLAVAGLTSAKIIDCPDHNPTNYFNLSRNSDFGALETVVLG